jgi:UDP-N-acetyl-2-amino-2-deoxyglucuronate dehydrogenase
MSLNFALLGAAGYVAPRHLQAIRETGNVLVAACDPHDSVGILDQYFPEAAFFREFERFDRHVESLRRSGSGDRVHWVSVCSPNYLHDAHVRFAFRVGADAICEKPLALNPWNCDALQELEAEHGCRVFTVLQLRLHPDLVALKKRFDAERGRRHEVTLTYVTARGQWYLYSWKGDVERSGGLATNIGVHLFDLLLWLFGPAEKLEVHAADPRRATGTLALSRADVRWLVSIDPADVPAEATAAGKRTFRSLEVDGERVEFSDGFTGLHTRIYEEALNGRGFSIDDVRPSVRLVHEIRHAKPTGLTDASHPMARR